MADWDFAHWMKTALTVLAVFAIIGGIISQTSGGASGRGFMEGMWKGVEVFLLLVVGIVLIYGVLLMMGAVSTALNT